MLGLTTRNNENLREYFYDKLNLLNSCEVRGKKAVDCVIYGILDKSIRSSAQALTCDEPEDLLNFLSSQRPGFDNSTLISGRKRGDNIMPNRINNVASSSTDNSITCFNCRSKGHPYFRCPKPLIKCMKCNRVGHNNDNCKFEPLTLRNESERSSGHVLDRKTLNISTLNKGGDKFYKNVKINDMSLVAFIDFGSECTLIRESDARNLCLQKYLTNLPVIKGFGNSNVFPLFKSTVELKLDEIEANVEILVVNDEFLQSSILIGQNVTELPCVTVFKDSSRLLFYKSPEFLDNIRSTVSS